MNKQISTKNGVRCMKRSLIRLLDKLNNKGS